ncbi:small ribosomal subunit protein uS9m [Gastrolobium bilobum]|uniref:small ribosomal subunit protein uS9m n=1 Tax=Gastrolobium bilobum TaxID=150636 RepID=UPI002AB06964|nr:small ribosomal subunit protein uS9m [Gastrolobium bilobum]
MLSRLIPKPYHFRRFFSLPSKHSHFPNPHFNPYFTIIPKFFSSTNSSDDNNNNNNNRNIKEPFSSGALRGFLDSEEKFESFIADDSGGLAGLNEEEGEGTGAKAGNKEEQWWLQEKSLDNEDEDDLFEGVGNETGDNDGGFGGQFGVIGEGLKPWSLKEKEEEDKDDVFNFQEDVSQVGEFSVVDSVGLRSETNEEDVVKLEKEEKALTDILKGPNRAFGDLIAASGITDDMLDSLIALKDFEGVDGLPPLSVIEDIRYEKNTTKSTRAEMERLKQEEAAKARVRQVDEKGRAYGTGRRKCSVARVWVQPGNGKFVVNDKEYDVYFPVLDHRAALLRPFSETKTLGLWDVNCTVKGGGVSGQVGAIRLGISRALQNWEPDLRPALRSAGFLTRDSRVVERKKPGKAKARKSFQWVKR